MRNEKAKPVVGANLGFRKAWENCTPQEREAIVSGEDAVLDRARRFNAGRSLNGYGPGFTREECLKPIYLDI